MLQVGQVKVFAAAPDGKLHEKLVPNSSRTKPLLFKSSSNSQSTEAIERDGAGPTVVAAPEIGVILVIISDAPTHQDIMATEILTKAVLLPMPYYVKKRERIGIVGIGGLGHLAIQFAAKMGAEVIVFSGKESKRDQAMDLGASEFYVTKDLATKKPEKGIDALLVTTAKHPDWSTYGHNFIPLVNPFGTIYPLTIDFDPIVIPFRPFLRREISFTSSCTAAPEESEKMLAFAAWHCIKPVVEVFPMTKDGTTKAIERLASGELRYRAVLSVN